MPIADVLGLLAKAVGDDVAVGVSDVLCMIEKAEEMIDAAKSTADEDVASKLDASFGLLVPTPGMVKSGMKVYEAHVAEMLGRVARRYDTRPPTKAEMVAALSKMSLIRPITREASALYGRLFVDLFPDDAKRLGVEVDEGVEDARLEEVAMPLVRRLTVHDRF